MNTDLNKKSYPQGEKGRALKKYDIIILAMNRGGGHKEFDIECLEHLLSFFLLVFWLAR